MLDYELSEDNNNQIQFDLPRLYLDGKKIKLIELFGGIGSQAKALEILSKYSKKVIFEHYKLLEFELIESAGKLDAPGRPTMYQITDNFLKMFGISSLDELPELPRYKLDENEQIVIDDLPIQENEE